MTNEEIDALWNECWSNDETNTPRQVQRDFARALESRVLAERKEPKPVGWAIREKHFPDKLVFSQETGEEPADGDREWAEKQGHEYVPLFTHPTPDDARVVVDSYSLANDPDVTVQRVKQRDGTYLWAVRSGACCLNSSGEWEEEPMPSNRDDAFLSRCRFATADAAIDRTRQDKGAA